MIALVLIMLFWAWADKITIGERVIVTSEEQPKSPEFNSAWKFESLDDCMEYRELRATGWRGTAEDFYRWKREEEMCYNETV